MTADKWNSMSKDEQLAAMDESINSQKGGNKADEEEDQNTYEGNKGANTIYIFTVAAMGVAFG